MKNFIVTIILALTAQAYSHEGHNDAPGSFKSLHGGMVQNGKESNLEVVINGRELTVYPTGHDNKDIPSKDVTLTAQAKPKKGKPYTINLTPAKSGYSATLDLQGANRLPVEITVTSRGKTDKFTVQIEE